MPTTRRMSCVDCGFTGTSREVDVHSCTVEEFGGRCEDFPCCGHTDGCQTRPEHTAAYWLDLRDAMGDDAYEAYCEALAEQGL